jgi:hypothetical protein
MLFRRASSLTDTALSIPASRTTPALFTAIYLHICTSACYLSIRGATGEAADQHVAGSVRPDTSGAGASRTPSVRTETWFGPGAAVIRSSAG